jgi:CRISPR-associated protein Csd1
MLNELVNYAGRQCPDAEPGFAPKDVRWAISLSSGGEFLGLLSLGDTTLRRNPGRTFSKAPDLSQGELIVGGETKSHFLVETLAVVAQFGKPEEVAKNQPKRKYFISLLKLASACMPPLSAAAFLLEDEQGMQRLRCQLDEAKAKPTDKATFCIDGEFPVESEAWYDWWRSFRAGLAPSEAPTDRMLCFITGEAVQPAPTHPKISRLPGANPSGAALIGFDKDAFESYGLKQSANAAMSEEAAKAYQSGLNRLIRRHSARLGGVLVVHWYRSTVAPEDDPLAWLEDSAESTQADAQIRARKLLTAIRDGARRDLAGNTYYALSLSGNGGRVMVRDWMEGAFEELAGAIDAWFSDLAIVRPQGGGIAPPPPFFALLKALVDPKRDDDVPAPLAARLFRAAVRAESIPFAAMAQALARTRVDFIQGNALKPGRMGLLRAYFARKQSTMKGVTEMPETIQPGLTESLASPAYQCGRLMAVLAALQRAALGDVGADVIQRYYAAASTTPALVFGRLVRTAQFHLGKVKQEGPGLAWWYEERIAGVCTRIGKSMPATLTLEEQSMFALGYYQQLAALRTPKENEAKEGEK